MAYENWQMTHTIRKSIKFRALGIWLILDCALGIWLVFGSLFYLSAFLYVLERNGVWNAIGPWRVKVRVLAQKMRLYPVFGENISWPTVHARNSHEKTHAYLSRNGAFCASYGIRRNLGWHELNSRWLANLRKTSWKNTLKKMKL